MMNYTALKLINACHVRNLQMIELIYFFNFHRHVYLASFFPTRTISGMYSEPCKEEIILF